MYGIWIDGTRAVRDHVTGNRLVFPDEWQAKEYKAMLMERNPRFRRRVVVRPLEE